MLKQIGMDVMLYYNVYWNGDYKYINTESIKYSKSTCTVQLCIYSHDYFLISVLQTSIHTRKGYKSFLQHN